jgi:hypothetical protein
MFEGLVNLLPILKGLAHASPDVELPKVKNDFILGIHT